MRYHDGDAPAGTEILDSEHEQLNRLLEDLREALETGADSNVVADVFEQLVESARRHFRTEESHFRALGYPHATAHETEHRELLKMAFVLRDRFAGRSPHARADALQFIRDWQDHHATGSDVTFDGFLAAQSPPSSRTDDSPE